MRPFGADRGIRMAASKKKEDPYLSMSEKTRLMQRIIIHNNELQIKSIR